ncbi:MAG: hypothetical protein ACR65O_06820 [Methylomicrobium sp.]|jgi:hypothetical protein
MINCIFCGKKATHILVDKGHNDGIYDKASGIYRAFCTDHANDDEYSESYECEFDSEIEIEDDEENKKITLIAMHNINTECSLP